MRWWYSRKFPVSSSRTALRSSLGKHQLAHSFGSILIWPTSTHDNMTLATINWPWVWVLVFCACGLETACTRLGVALGIGLCGRLGVGVSGVGAADGASSWVMSGGGSCGVIVDATTTSVGHVTINCRGASSSNGISSMLAGCLASTLGCCAASTLGCCAASTLGDRAAAPTC